MRASGPLRLAYTVDEPSADNGEGHRFREPPGGVMEQVEAAFDKVVGNELGGKYCEIKIN